MDAVTPEILTNVAGAKPQIDVSIWGLIMKADLVVKAVMLSLFVASIMTWAIIFERFTF